MSVRQISLSGRITSIAVRFWMSFWLLVEGGLMFAVWTVGTSDYAAAIVAAIFPPEAQLSFVWSRERCAFTFDGETREYSWRKNMKKVRRRGYDLSQVIVADNTPTKWQQSYGNLVQVASFYGASEDNELPVLRAYLEKLADVANIRTIEKRGWRNHSQLIFGA